MPLTPQEKQELQSALEYAGHEYYFPGDVISVVLWPREEPHQALLQAYIADILQENPELRNNIKEESRYGYKVFLLGHRSIEIVAGSGGLDLDAAKITIRMEEFNKPQELTNEMQNALADSFVRSTTGPYRLSEPNSYRLVGKRKKKASKDPDTFPEIFEGAYLLEGFKEGKAEAWIIFKEGRHRSALLEENTDGKACRLDDLFYNNPPHVRRLHFGEDENIRFGLILTPGEALTLKNSLRNEGISISRASRIDLSEENKILGVLNSHEGEKRFPRAKIHQQPMEFKPKGIVESKAEIDSQASELRRAGRVDISKKRQKPSYSPLLYSENAPIMQALQDARIIVHERHPERCTLYLPASIDLKKAVTALFYYHPAQYKNNKLDEVFGELLRHINTNRGKTPDASGLSSYRSFQLPYSLIGPINEGGEFSIPLIAGKPIARQEIQKHLEEFPLYHPGPKKMPQEKEPDATLDISKLEKYGRLVREKVGSPLLLVRVDNAPYDFGRNMPDTLNKYFGREPEEIDVGKKEYLRIPLKEQQYNHMASQGIPVWNGDSLIGQRQLARAMRDFEDPHLLSSKERLKQAEREDLKENVSTRSWIVQQYGAIRAPQFFFIPSNPQEKQELYLKELGKILELEMPLQPKILPQELRRYGIIRLELTKEQVERLSERQIPIYPDLPTTRGEEWQMFFKVLSEKAEAIQQKTSRGR